MIIFDIDGTLWDVAKITLKSSNMIANKYDYLKEFNLETIKKGMGLSLEENARNYFPYLEVEKAVPHLKEIMSQTVELLKSEEPPIYPNVIETIKKLSKKYHLGIITNNKDEYVEMFIEKSGLKDCFIDYMGAASHDMTKGEAIKEMAKRNNEPSSVYVGDIEKDYIATREAGQLFIHAKYGFGPNLISEYYINDISELPKLITKLDKEVI